MNGEGDDPRLVTAQFAVVYLNIITPAHVVVTEAQIRQWASRGHVGRHGRAPDGRTLYDLSEVRTYMRSRGLGVASGQG